MAYYSNYPDYPDNYQYNPYNNQSCLDFSSYDYSNTHEPRYAQYYDSEFHGNKYQHIPIPSFTGYYCSAAYDQHEFPAHKTANVCDAVSTEYMVSYSVSEPKEEADLEEFSREHFHGGYNMSETYGEPLPPSDVICYPPSKVEPVPYLADHSFDSVPSPYLKEDQNLETEPKPTSNKETGEEEGKKYVLPPGGKEDRNVESGAKPTEEKVVSKVEEEEKDSKFEHEEESEEEPEEEGEQGNNIDGEIEEKQIIRRQIPPGYGLEAMDLCEGVFGGYFPCLWKRYQQGRNDESNCNEVGDEGDCWRRTADYLFGNPNPYGGEMPEKGSYGDPVYSYQRHCPSQPLCEQVEYGGDYQWLPNSRYY